MSASRLISLARVIQLKSPDGVVDLSAATFQIHDESHTIGNALRWMLMKKCVSHMLLSENPSALTARNCLQPKGGVLRIQVRPLFPVPSLSCPFRLVAPATSYVLQDIPPRRAFVLLFMRTMLRQERGETLSLSFVRPRRVPQLSPHKRPSPALLLTGSEHLRLARSSRVSPYHSTLFFASAFLTSEAAC